jgi:hypothetical protein
MVCVQLHVLAATPPGKSPQYPLDTAWMLWRRDESLAPAGNQTPIPVVQAVAYSSYWVS